MSFYFYVDRSYNATIGQTDVVGQLPAPPTSSGPSGNVSENKERTVQPEAPMAVSTSPARSAVVKKRRPLHMQQVNWR